VVSACADEIVAADLDLLVVTLEFGAKTKKFLPLDDPYPPFWSGRDRGFPVFVGAPNWQFCAGFSCRNPLQLRIDDDLGEKRAPHLR
jgi:hypothetical protein